MNSETGGEIKEKSRKETGGLKSGNRFIQTNCKNIGNVWGLNRGQKDQSKIRR